MQSPASDSQSLLDQAHLAVQVLRSRPSQVDRALSSPDIVSAGASQYASPLALLEGVPRVSFSGNPRPTLPSIGELLGQLNHETPATIPRTTSSVGTESGQHLFRSVLATSERDSPEHYLGTRATPQDQRFSLPITHASASVANFHRPDAESSRAADRPRVHDASHSGTLKFVSQSSGYIAPSSLCALIRSSFIFSPVNISQELTYLKPSPIPACRKG
jgi:hypothetical protein